MIDWFYAILGGVLIGGGSSLLLLFKGRVFGVSGVIGGVLRPRQGDVQWRLAVLSGLVVGGAILRMTSVGAFDASYPRPAVVAVVAGLLVGFGTRLGNGCTSGHGVCGISRFSVRSIAATLVFVLSGMLTATVVTLVTRGGTP